MVYNKAYESNDEETGLDAMAGDGGYSEGYLGGYLRARM